MQLLNQLDIYLLMEKRSHWVGAGYGKGKNMLYIYIYIYIYMYSDSEIDGTVRNQWMLWNIQGNKALQLAIKNRSPIELIFHDIPRFPSYLVAFSEVLLWHVSWNTVDACEILHQLIHGLSPLFIGVLPSQVVQDFATIHSITIKWNQTLWDLPFFCVIKHGLLENPLWLSNCSHWTIHL